MSGARGLELPANLLQAVEKQDDAGSPHREWIARLPRMVGELAQRWSLRLGSPFQPGGVAAWVAPARDATGTRVVLKVGWRHVEAEHEADGLQAWAGNGAVRLLDSDVAGDTSALLLEACSPGTSLAAVLPPTRQDVVVAGLLRRLWIEPAAGHPFRTLTSMCDWWADSFDRKYAAAPPRLRLDPGLARAGSELFRSLPKTGDPGRLLCTDLHPGNVLAAQREPWLMIDPKPYLGDPTYDALQYLLNFPGRLVADPAGFSQRMAELLHLDVGRLRQWLFARCVLESVDQPGLRVVSRKLAP